MLHNLIDSAENWKYQPFAKNCINKLKRLGMAYADQSYEIDGVSIKVRIEPGHEYIRIEGGGGELPMDSGAVHLGITNPNTETVPPGVLYEVGGAISYNTKFVLPGADLFWRVNPTKFGQISGYLVGGGKSFSGAVPVDKQIASSFTAGNELKSSDPDVWADKVKDSALMTKKITAATCPPSMFTGRCRLWVQAIYGLYNYRRTRDDKPPNSSEKKPTDYGTFTASSGGQPRLRVPSSHKKEGAIWISTSSGVFLDRTTGEHWLFNMANNEVAIYPLISSPAGERCRKYLITGRANGLTETDLEHLEAHILSRCLPDTLQRKAYPLSTEIAAYAMGYGWHWNWDGTVADIVLSKTFQQPNDGSANGSNLYAMESTHWRVQVGKVVSAVGGKEPHTGWSVAVAAVEGPKKWCAKRPWWVIAEPDWGTTGLMKSTPRYTTMFACDAPFYAFYRRNELQVCRVSVSETDEVPELRVVRTEIGYGGSVYAAPWYGGPIYQLTEGTKSGACEDRHTSKFHEGTFTVGGYSSGAMTLGKIVQSLNDEATFVTDGARIPSEVSPNFYDRYYYLNQSFSFGYKTPSGAYSFVEFSEVSNDNGNNAAVVSYERNSSDIRDSSQVTIIIPVYDSEAVFIHHQKDTTKVIKDREVRTFYVYGLISWKQVVHPVWFTAENGSKTIVGWTMGAFYTYYGVSSAGIGGTAISTTNPETVSTSETTGVVKKLISKTTVEVTNFDTYPFHFNDVDDSTGYGGLWSMSGTSVSSPVVICNGRFAPVGAPSSLPNNYYPALVGWV